MTFISSTLILFNDWHPLNNVSRPSSMNTIVPNARPDWLKLVASYSAAYGADS
jgi:hypothetical protein